MRNLIVVVLCFATWVSASQELNCELIVNAQQTGNENVQVFRTMERQLKEFVNNTQWTNRDFLPQERIECSMVLNITDYNNDVFQGSLQIRSARPVYNSTYSTPIYNYNDRDFTFRYLEFQNLNFNANQFQSNLISVLAFHIYIMLGMDADSFAPNGGEAFYETARNIMLYSQQSNFKGWAPEDGLQSRYVLIDNILSGTFNEFRSVLYDYHRNGLDVMHDNPRRGKEAVASAVNQFLEMNNRRPNSFLLRTFFDAKAEEILDIFSDGPSVNIAQLVDTLNKIAPMHSNKWRNINF